MTKVLISSYSRLFPAYFIKMIESMSFIQSQTNFTGLPCSYMVVGRDKGGIKASFGWKENEGFLGWHLILTSLLLFSIILRNFDQNQLIQFNI